MVVVNSSSFRAIAIFSLLCFMASSISYCKATSNFRSFSTAFRCTSSIGANQRATIGRRPPQRVLTPFIFGTTEDRTVNVLITRTMSTTETASDGQQVVPPMVVDPFCYRQFSEFKEQSKNYGGTVFDTNVKDFTEKVNTYYSEDKLVDGYAPFCKHLFIPNDGISNAQVNVLEITPENEHLLRTRYEARNEKELPVLSRYFPKDLVCGSDQPSLPTAKYLDLILYSREQIQKENAAMGQDGDPSVTSPWGIVSIKAQDVDHELPMQPITMMRNALGKEEGGSGVKLDKDKYMESYNYWNNHAVIA